MVPDQTPQGQVVQKGSSTLGSDTAPVNEETGSALKMQVIEGKKGSVSKLTMGIQTDYTDAHAGHAPPYDGPGKISSVD